MKFDIKKYLAGLSELWMGELYKEQSEYEKSRCLTPNDGSDWRRIR